MENDSGKSYIRPPSLRGPPVQGLHENSIHVYERSTPISVGNVFISHISHNCPIMPNTGVILQINTIDKTTPTLIDRRVCSFTELL